MTFNVPIFAEDVHGLADARIVLSRLVDADIEIASVPLPLTLKRVEGLLERARANMGAAAGHHQPELLRGPGNLHALPGGRP